MRALSWPSPIRTKNWARVEEFAVEWGSNPTLCFPCDVASDEDIALTFEKLAQQWGALDCIVHSVGFAPGGQLDGAFTEATTRDGFRFAHDTSAYSFVALAKAGAFLCSDLASGISGEIMYVDGGFNTTAMGNLGDSQSALTKTWEIIFWEISYTHSRKVRITSATRLLQECFQKTNKKG